MTDNPLNYLSVGPHGTFQKSGELNSSPEAIDILFKTLAKQQQDHIALYFHGGLVKEEAGKATADRQAEFFTSIGAHPIFFIWETGAVETIRDNISKLLTSPLVGKLLRYALGQISKRWGIEIAGKGPGESLAPDEIEVELAKAQPFASWDQQAALVAKGRARGGAVPLVAESLSLHQQELEVELDETISMDVEALEQALLAETENELLSPDLRQGSLDTRAKGLDPILIANMVKITVQVCVSVLRRRVKGQDHGLYPTVAEELMRASGLDGAGKTLWDAMKEKAAEMWLPNPDPITPGNVDSAHVGTYFLKRLIEYSQATPNLKVDLIGHSAGSIVICNLLRVAAERYPAFKFGRIALLAPGVTMQHFHKELLQHPERYESFRLFSLKDKWESKDAIAGPVYPRSLLYFVSGVLEPEADTPLSGLERHSSGAAPYQAPELLAAHDFIYASGKNRLVLSRNVSNPLGMRSASLHHGAFSHDNTTWKSLQVFLAR